MDIWPDKLDRFQRPWTSLIASTPQLICRLALFEHAHTDGMLIYVHVCMYICIRFSHYATYIRVCRKPQCSRLGYMRTCATIGQLYNRRWQWQAKLEIWQLKGVSGFLKGSLFWVPEGLLESAINITILPTMRTTEGAPESLPTILTATRSLPGVSLQQRHASNDNSNLHYNYTCDPWQSFLYCFECSSVNITCWDHTVLSTCTMCLLQHFMYCMFNEFILLKEVNEI